jgi:hypothetical protein
MSARSPVSRRRGRLATRAGRGEQLFGDHQRWLADPGPFLDDLDLMCRRRRPAAEGSPRGALA